MLDKVTGVGLATATVITFYNAYPLFKVLGDGDNAQGAADARFQEKYRRHSNSLLIDELYLKNKQIWVVSGVGLAAGFLLIRLGH
jgi:hypothetical protein